MRVATRATASAYLEWAKLCSQARYNLATSGIKNYPLSELPVSIRDLEINGPTYYGYGPLQERLAQKHGVETDSVVAANGTAMANHLAMAAVVRSGDDVLIERPTYSPIVDLASYLGANILRFERRSEEGFEIDVDEIKKRITEKTRLIVLANLHNPTGAFIQEKTLIEIGEVAATIGARVLVDEAYLDTVFDPPARSAFHLGDHFMVTSSLTKAYGLSGLRCGWILAEPKLAERIWKLNDLFGATPVHVSEMLSVVALDHLDPIRARAKELVSTNRRALDAFFDSRTDIDVFRPRWGTVSSPKLKRGSVDEFCELLRARYDTSVVPGHFFEMPEHVRIGIGGDPEMTAKALEQLGHALDACQP